MSLLNYPLGVALIGLLLPTGPILADTMSYADSMIALAQQCGSDIKRHCNGVNLDEVQACLQKNSGKISAGCTQAVPEVAAALQQREAAQASFAQACGNDANRLCKGVTKGNAHILGCLLKASHAATAKCNQAITDAGWR
jgi:Cysteine rich repeat